MPRIITGIASSGIMSYCTTSLAVMCPASFPSLANLLDEEIVICLQDVLWIRE
ncbi:MAG TPA: hypothetical protein VFS36_02205 [Chitinophagaceae bacterium]|nr:hypothetical protein [Chitinophagaceae bacterium]